LAIYILMRGIKFSFLLFEIWGLGFGISSNQKLVVCLSVSPLKTRLLSFHNSPSPSYFKRGTLHIVILSLNVPLKTLKYGFSPSLSPLKIRGDKGGLFPWASCCACLLNIDCIHPKTASLRFCSWIVVKVYIHNSPSPSYLKRESGGARPRPLFVIASVTVKEGIPSRLVIRNYGEDHKLLK